MKRTDNARRVGGGRWGPSASETAGRHLLPGPRLTERGVECAQAMFSAEKRETDYRSLASALNERDRAILTSLLEHKILTTEQLTALFFRSRRRCQHRMRELKDLELTSAFEPANEFGRGRLPDHHHLTETGSAVLARLHGVARSSLSWIPDEDYRDNRNLRHRIGVNAFFCALIEASRQAPGHCMHQWRPERRVRTPAGEIQPDGFGRYLHPGGAFEFYLEYDRGTEGPAALTTKLEGYLALHRGWGQGGGGFPNVLVLVPNPSREAFVAAALTAACGRRNAHDKGAPSMFSSTEELVTGRGILGALWLSLGDGGERIALLDLPARDASPYDPSRCLGRHWTEDGFRTWGRISPASAPPHFPTRLPRRRE